MPVLGVFAIAAYASYHFGVASGPAVGISVFAWVLVALLTGVPLVAIGCVIVSGNIGWLAGLWLQSEIRTRPAL